MSQVPRRAIRHFLPLRREGHRIRLRRRPGGAGERVPQVCAQASSPQDEAWWLLTATSRSLTLSEAETLALRTLKQVMEEKLDAKNVQLASITKDKGFRIYSDEEMKDVVGRLEGN